MRVEAEAAAAVPRGRGQAIPLRRHEGPAASRLSANRPISLSQPPFTFSPERLDRGSAAFNFYVFPAFDCFDCFAVEAIQTIDRRAALKSLVSR